MRGSLRGGASQIQQTSSTPAATEEDRRWQGRREREREGEREREREREREGERERDRESSQWH